MGFLPPNIGFVTSKRIRQSKVKCYNGRYSTSSGGAGTCSYNLGVMPNRKPIQKTLF